MGLARKRKRVVFLSMDDVPDHAADDRLVLEPLAERGVEIDIRPWRTTENWTDYDAAVIRSTWDYPSAPERFLSVLSGIRIPLYNGAETVAWNYNKNYLSRYSRWTLPTHFHQGSEIGSELLARYRASYGDVVVKPAVGLGGYDTFLLTDEEDGPVSFTPERLWMLQPLARSIRTEGELSLIYFQRELSHAVLKKPGDKEFRIHEHFGGSIEPVQPDGEASTLAERVLGEVEDELLYARVDLVKYEGSWRLMELEAIEPSLYLQYDSEAPERFAEALVKRLMG